MNLNLGEKSRKGKMMEQPINMSVALYAYWIVCYCYRITFLC